MLNEVRFSIFSFLVYLLHSSFTTFWLNQLSVNVSSRSFYNCEFLSCDDQKEGKQNTH